MKVELPYNDLSSQTALANAELALGIDVARPTFVEVHAATTAGSPLIRNQDAFAAVSSEDVIFAGVFTGAPNLKPLPGLWSKLGARFAPQLLKNDMEFCSPSDTPTEVLLKLNKSLRVASVAMGATLEDIHTLPGATGTVIKLDSYEKQLTFAHVGGSYAIAYYGYNNSKLLTHDSGAMFNTELLRLIQEIAQARSITPRQAVRDRQVQNVLGSVYSPRNNPNRAGGNGHINGDPNLRGNIQSGSIMLDGLKVVLLGTAGLTPPGWTVQNEDDRQNMLTQVGIGGFESLFRTKRRIEAQDPDWKNVRLQDSADATGILIQL